MQRRTARIGRIARTGRSCRVARIACRVARTVSIARDRTATSPPDSIKFTQKKNKNLP